MIYDEEHGKVIELIYKRLEKGETAANGRSIPLTNILDVRGDRVYLRDGGSLYLSGLTLSELYDIQDWLVQKRITPRDSMREAMKVIRESIKDEDEAYNFYNSLINIFENLGRFDDARSIREIAKQEKEHKKILQRIVTEDNEMKYTVWDDSTMNSTLKSIGNNPDLNVEDAEDKWVRVTRNGTVVIKAERRADGSWDVSYNPKEYSPKITFRIETGNVTGADTVYYEMGRKDAATGSGYKPPFVGEPAYKKGYDSVTDRVKDATGRKQELRRIAKDLLLSGTLSERDRTYLDRILDELSRDVLSEGQIAYLSRKLNEMKYKFDI